uniref:Uncharacterized protein n=1 Tax=Siphoviridae sp. ctixZ6 TaxID=2826437 RepID=A0A8S5N734_9CAUD|nr:MAG TPA: hypothetical protein [Siphoviridae sp. ctixZ6]
MRLVQLLNFEHAECLQACEGTLQGRLRPERELLQPLFCRVINPANTVVVY